MLSVNLPRVSSVDSFLPDSTPNRLSFPVCVPDAMRRESGEKAIVQASTGPASIVLRCLPVSMSQIRMLLSRLLDAATASVCTNLRVLIIAHNRR